jgi:hypothetical protein
MATTLVASDAYCKPLVTIFFWNEESAHLDHGLNSDRGGHFSRQLLLEICSCFRQPNP